MIFFTLLGLLLFTALWIVYRVSNSNNRVDVKELAKSWRARMPQEIREYQYDKTNSTAQNSRPIISDTSEVKVRESGPETIKRISQLDEDKVQFKLFADLSDTDNELDKANNPNDQIHKKSEANDVYLLKVYVCDSNGGVFDPEKLVSALNIAGLTFGEMDIFHYYQEDSTTPAFSAASMLEPGTFDLGRLQLVRTSGIVLFIGSSSSASWPDDFHLLLTAAKRIATSLDAELYSAPGIRWTEEHEQKVLEKLEASDG